MKKKGFTLIELLAVIVILAIIALIAVPIVLNIINNSKESAKLRSAELYLDAVNNSIAQYQLGDNEIANGTYEIMSDGNICLGTITDGVCDNTLEVSVDGEKPVGDSLTIENSKIKDVTLNYGTDKILMDENGNLTYEVVLAPGLYNAEGELLATWDELVNDYSVDIEKDYTSYSKDNLAATINSDFREATKLIVGGNPTKIGSYAFWECFLLETIELPNSITSINENAFACCESLTSIEIPSSVTSIGDGAFSGCLSLTSIYIPSSVTNIMGLIYEINIIETVVVDENNPIYDSRDNCNAIIETATNIMLLGSRNTTFIPSTVTRITGSVFWGNEKIKSIVIPSSVTTIDQFAFEECRNLATVYFEHTTAPTFEGVCFQKNSSVITTFYFKNSTVADAFTTDYYDATYGIKSTDYNW